MFTGIIESLALVTKRSNTGIAITRPKDFENLSLGQSLAVNGACLTIVDFDNVSMRFDVVPETYARTNLKSGDMVNLERAMPANGRFEGHVVLGHVDGTATLIERNSEGEGERFSFSIPENLKEYFVEKGPITINGISLTIALVKENLFEIAVIPHTLKITNLGKLQKGERVNIEVDYFAKLLKKWNTI